MAALAATSAFAQSSVTVSGNLALSVGSTKWGTASSGLQIGRHTGNFALAGSEDLGGGLRANFRLETSIGMIATTNQTAPANTTGNNTNSGNTTLGDRGAAITLTGGFGSLTVGRNPTATRSLFGAMGDVSRMQPLTTISAGSNSNSGTLGLNDAAITGDQTARIIVGDAYANMVAYTSPSMNGFQVAVGMVPVQTANTGVGNTDATKDTYSISGMYSKGPLSLGANLTDAKGGTANKQTTIVGSYDLGVAKVGLTYQAVDLATGVDPGKSTVITAAVPYGSGNFGLAYGKRGATASTQGDDAKHMVLGYRYDLSKRTSVNLVWVKLDRAGGSASDVKEQHITLFHSF